MDKPITKFNYNEYLIERSRKRVERLYIPIPKGWDIPPDQDPEETEPKPKE